MKIKFNKKKIRVNIFVGLTCIALGIFNILETDKKEWSDFAYLVLGALAITHYLYDLKTQYLTINNGTISKNILYGLGGKIQLKDVTLIKSYAGDFTLITDSKKFKIDAEFIDDTSLEKLKEVLSNLNLAPENTPFKKQEA
ncbi:hypothetical protein [Olleya namhaensis]|uniref:hypothetical protein n=1 Tax=Olleya namhaensis TaxID=1144750 RepID=UPI00248F8BBF|nr:hypothetical protein [Olleya namhaensis]